MRLYTVSQKTCKLIFCSVSVKYEPISTKNGRHAHVLEETLNKTAQKYQLHLKYGKFEVTIEPSTQYFDEGYILMNH